MSEKRQIKFYAEPEVEEYLRRQGNMTAFLNKLIIENSNVGSRQTDPWAQGKSTHIYHMFKCEHYETTKVQRVEIASLKRHVEKLREQNANLLRRLLERLTAK